jgi:ectoine hydroxylase-related dioxygenase (phytanoyl-CoA dioxygenase family)
MMQTNVLDAAQAVESNKTLAPTAIEALKKSFADDGFFIVRNVVSRAQLTDLQTQLVTEFDRAKQSGTLFSGGGLMSGHLNCFPGAGARFVYDTLKERGIIDLIRDLEPKATRMPYVGCNFNLPHSVTQHYHTDRNFTNPFMIANVAVVDTVVENGATEVIPGSHHRYYKYWQFAVQRPYRNSIRVPLAQGDIMVRTSNVWHRGMPNLTSVPRPMLALTWEDGGNPQEDPFAAENGKITFRPNWFSPTRLGRIRERIFVSVPVSYSAYRFVTSLYSNKGY